MTVRNRLLNLLFIPLTVLGLNACSEPSETTATAPNLLQQAIDSETRSASNRARDEFRHPAETLEFFGIQPTSTVVEISPGGGWYTEILAPYLKDEGLLTLHTSRQIAVVSIINARAKLSWSGLPMTQPSALWLSLSSRH